MSSVLAAATTFVVGLVVGAAVQRWGDGVRASRHLGTEHRYLSSWSEPDDGVARVEYGVMMSYDGVPFNQPDWSAAS